MSLTSNTLEGISAKSAISHPLQWVIVHENFFTAVTKIIYAIQQVREMRNFGKKAIEGDGDNIPNSISCVLNP